MSAHTRIAVSTLTAALFTAGVVVAGPASARQSERSSAVFVAGDCGRFDTRIQPGKLNLKVGKPGRLSVAFTTERPCVLDVAVRPLGRDTGIAVGPAEYVRIQTPATFVWTVTGTKKIEDLLVASVHAGGAMFGVRLPDVSVR